METSDFFYQIRTLCNTLIQLLAKVVSASLSKMTFTTPEELFEENKFLKTFTKVTCFWFCAKNVWQDAQTAFTCPVEQWWKVVLFGENESLLSFPHIMWIFFATSNKIGRAVNLAFNISSGTFRGKNRLNETVFRFSPSFDSERKTLGRVLTSASYASRGALWRGTVFWNDFFFNLAEWFLVELRTAIYMSRRTFLTTSFEKSVFCFDSRTLSKKLVRLFPKCFRQFLQNWHPCVKKNKLRRQLFFGNCRLFLSSPHFEQ